MCQNKQNVAKLTKLTDHKRIVSVSVSISIVALRQIIALHWDRSQATVSKEFRIPCFWLILVLKAHNITNLFVLYIFVVWLMENILQKGPSLRVMSDHNNLRSWVSICLIRPRTLCQVKSSSIAMEYRSLVSGDTPPIDIFDKKMCEYNIFANLTIHCPQNNRDLCPRLC